MRILHITSHLEIGGITRYIVSLSERLIARGHRVVVASAGGSVEARATALGVTHWSVPFRTSAEFSPQVLWGTSEVARRLREDPADVIHAHTRVGQVAAELLARRLGIPVVTTWHGIYRPNVGRWLWPCFGNLTMAISDPVYQNLRRDFHVPSSRIRRIYNGIDPQQYAVPPTSSLLQAFRERWGLPVDCPIVGAVGRLASGKVKGFDTLLVAAYLLQDLIPEVHFLIVGDGPRYPFLKDVARRLQVQSRVHFVGAAEDARVPLAVMDLFVFSSRWPEAFGLTLVEAMAAGKPVVATQVGAVPEIVRHGVEGWLVPPNDPRAMADGIARLLQDRPMATRMGQAAQVRVREAFGLDRMTREVEAVYREVVGHD